MSHPNLVHKLRDHYPPKEGWGLYAEVESATGGPHQGTRRADGVLVNIWPSRGGLFYILLEQKHSLSDLGNERRCPSKAEEIGQFCRERWLVVPPTLKLRTRPQGWRVLVVGPGKPYFVDDDGEPPAHPVVPPTDGFLQSLLASGCTAAEDAAVSEAPMVSITRPTLSRTHAGLACGHTVQIAWKVGKAPAKAPCFACLDGASKDLDVVEAVIDEADEPTLRRLREQIDRRIA